jgi:hypothetical protein
MQFVYNEVCHYLFDCHRAMIPLYYLAAMVAFYIWHLMCHTKWNTWPLSSMFADHMEHHWVIYPPTKVLIFSCAPITAKLYNMFYRKNFWRIQCCMHLQVLHRISKIGS